MKSTKTVLADRIRTMERRQWIGMAAFALLFVAALLDWVVSSDSKSS